MRHIKRFRPGTGKPVCGAELTENDQLVFAAMQSDCNDCRTKIGIIPTVMRDVDGKVHGFISPVLESWEPKPMDFPSVEELAKMRDGF